jgi:hypothetical protein
MVGSYKRTDINNLLSGRVSCHKSQDSSVGIATGYRLDDRIIVVRFLAGAGNCSLVHHVQTDSGAHSAYYSVGTAGSSLRVKHPRRTTHLQLFPRSKNAWS